MGAEEESCQDLLVPGKPVTDNLLERLARCLGHEMRLQAMRRCGNEHDAEDAVQDAMATAMRYLGGFRGDTSLRIWLMRLVNTACIHQRRGRRNDPSLHFSLDAGEGYHQILPDPSLAAEEVLLAEEKISQVADVLQTLPEPDRVLLLRHEGDDVPLAQLAEESGSTVAAVRSRLYRVRQRLRSQLEVIMHGSLEQEQPAL